MHKHTNQHKQHQVATTAAAAAAAATTSMNDLVAISKTLPPDSYLQQQLSTISGSSKKKSSDHVRRKVDAFFNNLASAFNQCEDNTVKSNSNSGSDSSNNDQDEYNMHSKYMKRWQQQAELVELLYWDMMRQAPVCQYAYMYPGVGHANYFNKFVYMSHQYVLYMQPNMLLSLDDNDSFNAMVNSSMMQTQYKHFVEFMMMTSELTDATIKLSIHTVFTRQVDMSQTNAVPYFVVEISPNGMNIASYPTHQSTVYDVHHLETSMDANDLTCSSAANNKVDMTKLTSVLFEMQSPHCILAPLVDIGASMKPPLILEADCDITTVKIQSIAFVLSIQLEPWVNAREWLQSRRNAYKPTATSLW